MSVYKRPGARTFSYDFQVGGHRFSGDTGETTERKARTEEERLKKQERARIIPARDRKGRTLTVEGAFVRYMEEVGNYHVNALTTLDNLMWLQAQLGRKTLFRTIDDEQIARIVARRRVELRKVGKESERKKQRPVSNATVNRSCTELIRKVMRRARLAWKCPVQEIEWSQHLLEEPKERVREASIQEEAAMMDDYERGYDDAISFAFLSGCRKMEIVCRHPDDQEPRRQGLVWTRVDFHGRRITVIGKAGKERVIPMSDALFVLLWEQIGNHPTHVFTYEAQRTNRAQKTIRGQRYPITLNGLTSMARRVVKRTGVVNFHPLHDIRHTNATRTLRKSNLRAVQNLLGHEDPSTTAKYAHALLDDMRAAMDATSPTRLPTDEVEFRLKSLAKKG